MGQPTCTDVLAERDQERVDLDPVASRQARLQLLHALLGCWSANVAPPVRDPVDMDINGNALLATGNSQGQMSALGADSAKGAQHIDIAGQLAAVSFERLARDILDLSSLGFMEGHVTDQLVNVPVPKPGEVFRLRRGFEEPAGSYEAHLIPSADREDTGNELLEERAIALLREGEHRGLGEWAHHLADLMKNDVDIERMLTSTRCGE